MLSSFYFRLINRDFVTSKANHKSYICIVNIRDLINRYKTDERIVALAKALNAGKGNKLQLKGLVGSADATIATATYFLLHKPEIEICRHSRSIR